MKNIKFLFFIERELHIPMLLNLMKYIAKKQLGIIGISSFKYQAADTQFAGWGLRKETLGKYIDFEYEEVTNPYEYKPDITFMSDFSYHYVEGLGKIVNIGHGTISKGWFFSENNISKRENCADLICVPGDIHKEILKKQIYRPIEVTGMPKLDPLYDYNETDKKEMLLSLGLNPENKTVLFAPTFNKELSLIPYVGDNLRKYIPEYLNLIIKLHGATAEEWKSGYSVFANQNKNVCYYSNLDVTIPLFLADVLITDVSSVIYEFLSLNKPVLLFDSPDQQQFMNYNPDNLEFVYRNVGERFSNPEKIQELLFKALLNPQKNPEIENIAQSFVSVRNGTSSEKVVNAALDLLNKEDKKEGTLIIFSESENKIKKLRDLYSSRYQVIIISENMINMDDIEIVEHKDFFSSVNEAIKLSKNENILVFSNDWTPSPMMPTFMFSQFMYDESVGMVVPLMSDSDVLNLQNINYHFRTKEKPSSAIIALQLTYNSPGEFMDLDYPEFSPCFAIKKKTWSLENDYTDLSNKKLTWIELVRKVILENKKIIVARDSFLYKTQEKNKFSPKHKKENVIIKKTTSTIQNKSKINRFKPVINQPIDEIKKELEQNPLDPDVLKKIVYYYLNDKQYDNMEVYANMLTDDPEGEMLVATALEKQQLPDEALVKISQIQLNRIHDEVLIAEILALKGILLIKTNQTEAAYMVLEQALNIFPDCIKAMVGLGSYYLISQNLDKAAEQFKKILDLAPNNEQALFGMGIYKQNSGSYEEASEYFKKVVLIDEENLNAINGLLHCSTILKEYDEIEEVIETYLEYHPADLNMLFVLAGVYFRDRKLEKAHEAIEKVILFDENFAGARELELKIKNDLGF